MGDILHFKPDVVTKRTADDEAGAVPAAKVRKKLAEIERSRKDLPFEQLTDEEKLKMLQAAESEMDSATQGLLISMKHSHQMKKAQFFKTVMTYNRWQLWTLPP